MRDHLLGMPRHPVLLAELEATARLYAPWPRRRILPADMQADRLAFDRDATKALDAPARPAKLDVTGGQVKRLIKMRGGCQCAGGHVCGPCSRPVTAEELEALREEEEGDGWREHDGKGCPLPMGTMYEVRVRGLDEPRRYMVTAVDFMGGCHWTSLPPENRSAVTHYRVVKAAP